jgi:hypothetical protein
MDGLLVLIVLLAIYFIPTIVAAVRERQIVAILFLNLLTGWTFIGWVVALVWAISSPENGQRVRQQPEPAWQLPQSTGRRYGDPISEHATAVVMRADHAALARGHIRRDGGDDGGAPVSAAGLPPVGVFMEYEDTQGSLSSRLITIRRFQGPSGSRMLQAWCHMRDAVRSFREDRILSITDLTTGEVFDERASIATWLDDLEAAGKAAGPMLTDAATLLGFIAAADQSLAAAEGGLVADTLGALSGGQGFDATALIHRLAALAPDEMLVRAAAGRAASWPGPDRERLTQAVLAMPKVDGKSHPQERRAARAVVALINSPR